MAPDKTEPLPSAAKKHPNGALQNGKNGLSNGLHANHVQQVSFTCIIFRCALNRCNAANLHPSAGVLKMGVPGFSKIALWLIFGPDKAV
jgi:hypothetical protein